MCRFLFKKLENINNKNFWTEIMICTKLPNHETGFSILDFNTIPLKFRAHVNFETLYRYCYRIKGKYTKLIISFLWDYFVFKRRRIHINVKRIVIVISIDPPCKDGNTRFSTVPLKPFRQKCGRYSRFSDSKNDYFREFLYWFLLTINALSESRKWK